MDRTALRDESVDSDKARHGKELSLRQLNEYCRQIVKPRSKGKKRKTQGSTSQAASNPNE